MEVGVVPFHQPCAGRVVSTVSVPAFAGLIEMLPFLLETLQSPKPPEASDDEDPDPQAARVRVSASALARANGRLRCMKGPLFPARGEDKRYSWSRFAVRACRVKDIGVTIARRVQ